jgi:hypothetical protein
LHAVLWIFPVVVGGGLVLTLIDYLIAWGNERREQRRELREQRSEERERRSEETAHEKERPRFRVDVTVVEGTHTDVPAARVEIRSLGGLPLTIDDGKVFIHSKQHPEHVETEQLKGRKIGPNAPIEVKFPLPEKLVNPHGVGKPDVQVVSDFSYDEGGKRRRYRHVQKYIHPRRFEQIEEDVQ